jgi:NADH:ubiquinone oxidoreductase subunit F (NADH-binding)
LPGLLPPHALTDHDAYLGIYGARPHPGEALITAVGQAGLTGRGGAGFPTARKLSAVREQRRRPVVLANGTEGEPASSKDKLLMGLNPHLVIDGALLAAEAVRARRVILAVSDPAVGVTLDQALESRGESAHVELVTVPERFVAGEESALINYVGGGEAKPTITPPRPFERGVDRRPTLVQNVETLANLALIARHGPAWARSAGTAEEPGMVLATISGAVRMSGVLEAPLGVPLSDLFARCGGLTRPAQAYLVGGYFGRWVEPAHDLALSRASLASVGGTLGARAIAALGSDACGVIETARVVSYMAEESAEQCGPCVFGLRALADRFTTIARSEPDAGAAYAQLAPLHRQIARRGACAHPDGVLEFAASATHVFAREFQAHLTGHCTAHSQTPVLPLPDGDWGPR